MASLTTSGRCKARDTVATDTFAAAAISLTVLTRPGGASVLANTLLPPCRLRLDPSALTRPASRFAAVLRTISPAFFSARLRRFATIQQTPRLIVVQCNVMDYMKSLHVRLHICYIL